MISDTQQQKDQLSEAGEMILKYSGVPIVSSLLLGTALSMMLGYGLASRVNWALFFSGLVCSIPVQVLAIRREEKLEAKCRQEIVKKVDKAKDAFQLQRKDLVNQADRANENYLNAQTQINDLLGQVEAKNLALTDLSKAYAALEKTIGQSVQKNSKTFEDAVNRLEKASEELLAERDNKIKELEETNEKLLAILKQEGL